MDKVLYYASYVPDFFFGFLALSIPVILICLFFSYRGVNSAKLTARLLTPCAFSSVCYFILSRVCGVSLLGSTIIAILMHPIVMGFTLTKKEVDNIAERGNKKRKL